VSRLSYVSAGSCQKPLPLLTLASRHARLQWETIRKGVNLKVSSAGAVTRGVFKLAYNSKLAAKKYGLPGVAGLADAVVFNKVKAQTGGRLRYVLSGGAALSRSTQEFLSTALVTTLQGYGLTETVGMCCILPPDFWSLGPSGVPVPSSASRSASELVRNRADPMFNHSQWRSSWSTSLTPVISRPTSSRRARSSVAARVCSRATLSGPTSTRRLLPRTAGFGRVTLLSSTPMAPCRSSSACGSAFRSKVLWLIRLVRFSRSRIKNLVKLAGGEYIALGASTFL
jgi:hypothetical protein